MLAENRARLAELTAQSRSDIRLAGHTGGGVELSPEPGLEPDRALECGGEFRRHARGLQRVRAAADRVLLGARPEHRAAGRLRPCAAARRRQARSGAAQSGGECAARFSAGGSRSASRATRPGIARSPSAWRNLPPNSRRTCSMRGAPTPAASPTEPSSRACPRTPSIAPPPMRARRNQPGWLFKLDQPTYMTVMASAESTQLRRDIYEAWVTRASELGPSAGRFDNNPIIAEILPLRHELARLVGFKNYADYALATRMAKSSKQVLAFLDDLARRCLPAARQEFSDLEEFAGRKLNAWDMAFYSERLQESRFKVSQEALRPVLPAAQGARRPVRADPAPVWHQGARAARRRRLASERALLRSARSERRPLSPVSFWIRTRAARSAAAPGWTSAWSRNPCPPAGRCRWRSWYAISPRRSAPRLRC